MTPIKRAQEEFEDI